MEFVIASSVEHKTRQLADLLGRLPGVRYLRGSVPEVGEGCDAQIMHFTLAHDRYGGRPIVGHSQVLHNARGDGAPLIIVSTPPLESGAGRGSDRDAETSTHVERMIGTALSTWVASLDSAQQARTLCCLIHIEGAGLDFGPPTAMFHGLGDAIRPYLGAA